MNLINKSQISLTFTMLCACFIKTGPGHIGYWVLAKCGDPSLTAGRGWHLDYGLLFSWTDCCCGSGLVAQLSMHDGHVSVAFNYFFSWKSPKIQSADPRNIKLNWCGLVEVQRLACDHATSPIIEKLRSKGVAMHAYGVSAYYAWTRNQLNDHGQSRLKWT